MTVGVTKVANWNRNAGFQSTALDRLWRERDYKWLKCLRQPLTHQSRQALRLTQSSPKAASSRRSQGLDDMLSGKRGQGKTHRGNLWRFWWPSLASWQKPSEQCASIFNSLGLPSCNWPRHQPLLGATHTQYLAVLALFRKRQSMRLSTPCILQSLPSIRLSISIADGQVHRCETLQSEGQRQNALARQPISSGQGSAHHWSPGPRRSDVQMSGSLPGRLCR